MYCVTIAIEYKLQITILKCEGYIIILVVITVIVNQSGSNKKSTICYAYITEILCVCSQQIGQLVIWLNVIKQFVYSYNGLDKL